MRARVSKDVYGVPRPRGRVFRAPRITHGLKVCTGRVYLLPIGSKLQNPKVAVASRGSTKLACHIRLTMVGLLLFALSSFDRPAKPLVDGGLRF